jgi:hypothetical protein
MWVCRCFELFREPNSRERFGNPANSQVRFGESTEPKRSGRRLQSRDCIRPKHYMVAAQTQVARARRASTLPGRVQAPFHNREVLEPEQRRLHLPNSSGSALPAAPQRDPTSSDPQRLLEHFSAFHIFEFDVEVHRRTDLSESDASNCLQIRSASSNPTSSFRRRTGPCQPAAATVCLSRVPD